MGSRNTRPLLSGLLACIAFILACAFAQSAELRADPFVIHYESAPREVAEETLALLRTASAQHTARLPLGEQPLHVYVAHTAAEFNHWSPALPAQRIQGFARSREGIIVIRGPALLGPRASYPGILRHELLHVLIARNTGEDNVPRWLNEGLAMLLSDEGRWSNSLQLANLYRQNRIVGYDTLPYIFEAPGNETQFGDAYVQSLAMTTYLRERLGEDSFWALINDLKTVRFDQALRARAGMTPHDFYDAWHETLWDWSGIVSILTGVSFFQLIILIALFAWWRKRRRGQRLMNQWDEEAADNEDFEILFPSDLEGREGPYPWEEDEGRL